jgi:hypothetical protein
LQVILSLENLSSGENLAGCALRENSVIIPNIGKELSKNTSLLAYYYYPASAHKI